MVCGNFNDVPWPIQHYLAFTHFFCPRCAKTPLSVATKPTLSVENSLDFEAIPLAIYF